MPVNEPSVSKEHRGPAKIAPSRTRSSKSHQAVTPGYLSGQASPVHYGSAFPLHEPDQCQGCCNHPAQAHHQCCPSTARASQATLVSTPIPISVPMPMPSGGGGPPVPIVINAPAAPPPPPLPPPPPPPPEPRPSAAQEVASMMMLTMVDYIRRRMDKNLERLFADDHRESSARPLLHRGSPDLGLSSLPRSPVTPLPTRGSSPSTDDTKESRHKYKKEKAENKENKENEEAGDINANQRGQPVAAISPKGADVVKMLDDALSPEQEDDESPQEEEEQESPSKGEASGRSLCCCCLVLWCLLLLTAFALAAAYLLFPDSVADILCSLGFGTARGLNDPDQIDRFNITNGTQFFEVPNEPEWGRSIFDVHHNDDGLSLTDSPQDDIRALDAEYDGVGEASSQVTNIAATTVENPLISDVPHSSFDVVVPSFVSLNHSDETSWDNGVFDEESSDDMIDFGSFIDMAAFGHLMRGSATPVERQRQSHRHEINGTFIRTSTQSDAVNETLAGIQDLLDRLGLTRPRIDAYKNTPANQLNMNHVTSGAAVAVEVDDEGEEWPVARQNPGYSKETIEYRGSATLDGF